MPGPDLVPLRRHFVRAFMFLAVVLAGTFAHANPDVARLAGLGSCSDCHADDRPPKKDTLNPIGLRYLGCQLNQACYDRLTAAVRTLQQAPAGQPSVQQQAAPAYAPAAAAPTTTAGAPRGSYQSRCRDVSVNADQTNLYGYCANAQNQTVSTRLVGFANCQSDIAVDGDGYLVCNLRGGGTNHRERVIEFRNSGWIKLTQIKMNTGSGGSWIQRPDVEMGKSLRFAMPASTPCLVQTTHSSGSFAMNTCMYHAVSVASSKARFE